MWCQKQFALTGELLLPFNIFLACFLIWQGELQYFLGFPLWPSRCWTLKRLFSPFFYMTSELLKCLCNFLLTVGFSPLVFSYGFLWAPWGQGVYLCISAAWPRTWPRRVLGSLCWIHINFCDDREIGQGCTSLEKPLLPTFTFYRCENWSLTGDELSLS